MEESSNLRATTKSQRVKCWKGNWTYETHGAGARSTQSDFWGRKRSK